ncbi:ferritin-like domain-containing protein [Streptomyces sp. NPDC048606]|uniref:ferritin-like domain-containing protein n=1 Tax=Streptomyces sp. NPDC048606 TaxID=3154726 RepID=UPI00341805EC
MIKNLYASWVRDFEAERERRAGLGDPDWSVGAHLPPELVRSLQTFQVGEDGDGSALRAKADGAGDASYSAAIRLFIAEEQNHARLLALLLEAAGAPTLTGHWSDAVFVRARRLMGLRLELMVLMVAESVALGYYRALRDGVGDPLTAEVASRLVADEERHVPFHCRRLHEGLAPLPRPARRAVVAGWRAMVAGGAVVVAADHGPALRALGTDRRSFVAGVVRDSAAMASAMCDGSAGAGVGRPSATTARAEGGV